MTSSGTAVERDFLAAESCKFSSLLNRSDFLADDDFGVEFNFRLFKADEGVVAINEVVSFSAFKGDKIFLADFSGLLDKEELRFSVKCLAGLL